MYLPEDAHLCSLPESPGAITSDAVTESTDYLIYGAMPGSKKVGTAMENGVNMVSEKGFTKMLQQNR